MDYQNKKKFKKKKARDKKSLNKILKKRSQKRYEDKLQKYVDKINWKNRERLEPVINDRDKSKKDKRDIEDPPEKS